MQAWSDSTGSTLGGTGSPTSAGSASSPPGTAACMRVSPFASNSPSGPGSRSCRRRGAHPGSPERRPCAAPRGRQPAFRMTAVRAYGAAMLGIVQRDWRLFISYRTRFLSQLLSGFFSLVLFYYVSRVAGGRIFSSPDDYFAFAVVGLVVMGVLVATLSTLPMAVRQELVAGTLERLVVSPFGAVAAIASMACFPFAFALINGVLTLTFAAAVFGMPVAWSTAALALPVGAL